MKNLSLRSMRRPKNVRVSLNKYPEYSTFPRENVRRTLTGADIRPRPSTQKKGFRERNFSIKLGLTNHQIV